MVALPGGSFIMGRDEGNLQERPAHSVTVSSFYVDRTETTNADYAVFVRETKYPAPAHWSGITPPAGQEKWPVVNVSKDDADVFAAWRSKRDGVSYRLPTEEEWEYAARNGSLNTLYPWGNFVIEVKHHSFEPVGSHLDRATYRGVYDMIGNAWEWTSSKFSPYPGNKISGNSEFRDWVVYRGGSYRSEMQGDDAKTAASRDMLPASRRSPVIGFRLVRSSP
jgi:formylglycine-generating enzyme required for sulfatase activity